MSGTIKLRMNEDVLSVLNSKVDKGGNNVDTGQSLRTSIDQNSNRIQILEGLCIVHNAGTGLVNLVDGADNILCSIDLSNVVADGKNLVVATAPDGVTTVHQNQILQFTLSAIGQTGQWDDILGKTPQKIIDTLQYTPADQVDFEQSLIPSPVYNIRSTQLSSPTFSLKDEVTLIIGVDNIDEGGLLDIFSLGGYNGKIKARGNNMVEFTTNITGGTTLTSPIGAGYHTFAMTIKGAVLKGYANGELVGETTGTTSSWTLSNITALIGSTARFFQAHFAQIYNVALDQATIQAIGNNPDNIRHGLTGVTGANIVQNGTFDTIDHWEFPQGGGSIANGVVTMDGTVATAEVLQRPLDIDKNNYYRIRFSVPTYTQGILRFKIGYGWVGPIVTPVAGESYDIIVYSDTFVSPNGGFAITPANSFIGSLDNVSLVKVGNIAKYGDAKAEDFWYDDSGSGLHLTNHGAKLFNNPKTLVENGKYLPALYVDRSTNQTINGVKDFKNPILKSFTTDKGTSNTIRMGSAYELFGTTHSNGGYEYYIQSDGFESGWSIRIGHSNLSYYFSMNGFNSPKPISAPQLKLPSLESFTTSPDVGWTFPSHAHWNYLLKGGNGERFFEITKLGQINVLNDLTANKLIKRGGTAKQFLKADGSVDEYTSFEDVTEALVPVPIYKGNRNYLANTSKAVTLKNQATVIVQVSDIGAISQGIFKVGSTYMRIFVNGADLYMGNNGTSVVVPIASYNLKKTSTLALSVNGATVNAYIDGELVGTATATSAEWVVNHYIYVGNDSVGNLLGNLHTIQLYDVALNQATIKSIGNNPDNIPYVLTGVTGSELVVNGGFSTTDTWTLNTGWAISGGIATFSGHTTHSTIESNDGIVKTGETYRLKFDVLNYTAGKLSVTLDHAVYAPEITANGSYEFILKAGNVTGPGRVRFLAYAGEFRGSIDNVSLVKLGNIAKYGDAKATDFWYDDSGNNLHLTNYGATLFNNPRFLVEGGKALKDKYIDFDSDQTIVGIKTFPGLFIKTPGNTTDSALLARFYLRFDRPNDYAKLFNGATGGKLSLLASGGNSGLVVHADGKIAIADSELYAPTQKLDVNGNIVGNTLMTRWGFACTAVDMAFTTHNLGYVRFLTKDSAGADTERMRLSNDGKLGIGTAVPAELLDVNGNALATKFIKRGGTSRQFLMGDGSTKEYTVFEEINAPVPVYRIGSGYLQSEAYVTLKDQATAIIKTSFDGANSSGAQQAIRIGNEFRIYSQHSEIIFQGGSVIAKVDWTNYKDKEITAAIVVNDKNVKGYIDGELVAEHTDSAAAAFSSFNFLKVSPTTDAYTGQVYNVALDQATIKSIGNNPDNIPYELIETNTAEVITNGTFDSGITGVTHTPGDEVSSISHNTTTPILGTGSLNLAITTAGTSGNTYSPVLTIATNTEFRVGHKYRFSITIRENSGNMMLRRWRVGGAINRIDQFLGALATYTFEFIATQVTGDLILEFDGRNIGDVDIDAVSIIQVGNIAKYSDAKATDFWYDESGNNVHLTNYGAVLFNQPKFLIEGGKKLEDKYVNQGGDTVTGDLIVENAELIVQGKNIWVGKSTDGKFYISDTTIFDKAGGIFIGDAGAILDNDNDGLNIVSRGSLRFFANENSTAAKEVLNIDKDTAYAVFKGAISTGGDVDIHGGVIMRKPVLVSTGGEQWPFIFYDAGNAGRVLIGLSSSPERHTLLNLTAATGSKFKFTKGSSEADTVASIDSEGNYVGKGSIAATSPNFPVGSFTRETAATGGTFDTFDGLASGFLLKTKSSGDMTNGFGGGLIFQLHDAAYVEETTYQARIYARRDGSDTHGSFQFFVGHLGSLAAMTMRSTGNVGIGTSNPAEKLEVEGKVISKATIDELNAASPKVLVTREYVDTKTIPGGFQVATLLLNNDANYKRTWFRLQMPPNSTATKVTVTVDASTYPVGAEIEGGVDLNWAATFVGATGTTLIHPTDLSANVAPGGVWGIKILSASEAQLFGTLEPA